MLATIGWWSPTANPTSASIAATFMAASVTISDTLTKFMRIRQLPWTDRDPPSGSMMQLGYDCEVVVLGLGAMGSCTLWALARRAVRTTGIDHFDPPHEQGSSHGETRVIRSAIIEGAAYLPLIRRAFALWDELAAEGQRELLVQTGVLFISRRGTGGITSGAAQLLQTAGLPLETYNCVELQRRYPQQVIKSRRSK
jgi:sarcosine oxidase